MYSATSTPTPIFLTLRLHRNAHEMAQITPETALYYTFYTTSTAPLVVAPGSPPSESALGPDTALQELKKLGCTLATKEWVDNHWSLILWKLSGMVCLDPERERDGEKRWCWGEVIRQLRYRSGLSIDWLCLYMVLLTELLIVDTKRS